MTKIVNVYFHLLKFIIVLCLLSMVVMVFSNVVLRYAFNSGIPVSEELSRWAFVWMTFLGSILVLKEHAHLGVDIVVKALPAALKKGCLAIAHILMIYITWLITTGSYEQTILNAGSNAPASGFSLAWLFGVGVIFGVSTLVINAYHLILIFRTPADLLDSVFQSRAHGEES